MNVDELLDLMEETLHDSMAVPLMPGKRMIEVERVQEIINDIRDSLPNEISQARSIVSERTQILNGAREEAEKTIKEAEARARAMVEEKEVVKAAQQRATDLLTTANDRANALTNAALAKCDSLLKETEDRLLKYTADIKLMRTNLKKPNPKNKKDSQ